MGNAEVGRHTTFAALLLAVAALTQTFNSPGTYLYFCSVHGSPSAGMRGTIVVQ